MEQKDALGKKLEEFSSEMQKYLKENDNLDELKQLYEEFISEVTKTKKGKEEEANKAQEELKEAIRKTEESVDIIDEGNLSSFKNMNKPSVSIMEIFKLMFLLFNPESDFPKDSELALIKSKCLNMSPKDIKKKMKMILQDISWITPDF